MGFCCLLGGFQIATFAQPPQNPPAAAEAPPPAADQPAVVDPAGARGGLVKLKLPITGDVDTRFRNALQRLLARFPAEQGTRPILVIEFSPATSAEDAGAPANPPQDDAHKSDFSRSQALAELLRSPDLQRVRVVGYIPPKVQVRGHAVLVALACPELIMARDAELGEGGIHDQSGIDRSEAYKAAAQTGGKPVPLALGFWSAKNKVHRAEIADAGVEFVLEADLPKLREQKNVTAEKALDRLPFNFTGLECKQLLGIVNYLAANRQELAAALKIPEKLLNDEFFLGAGAKTAQLRIEGVLSPALLAEIDKKLTQAHQDGVNFVLVVIRSPGGAPSAAAGLMQTLANLRSNDDHPFRTVAWIDQEALGDAAWIALGCDEIVMSPQARIGGYGSGNPTPDDRANLILAYKDHKNELDVNVRRGIAMQKNRPSWSLGAALIGNTESAALYRNKVSNLRKVFSPEELRQQADPAAWEQLQEIARANEPLELTGTNALSYGLAAFNAENMHQLKEHYGLEASPELLEPGWVDFLLRAIRNDYVMIFLLLIGGAGILAELQTPGVGLGGFIAFLCFMLYFWGQFLEGTAGWLEVLLFVFGLIFVLMEIFVFPGFGILGFGGGLMILASLILASQTTVIPTNAYQLNQLRNTLLVLLGAGAGTIGVAVLLHKFLPSTPGLNRMLLEPPSEQERLDQARRESLADFSHLLGQRGKTTTRLTPAGKALISDQLVDVVAPGDYIDPGKTIEVIEVRGHRVVVRAV
ncbi:MAG: NfeD family protein [Pirellulales bacterium]|nr:NfeD family protein [Pirellulales bacterium]